MSISSNRSIPKTSWSIEALSPHVFYHVLDFLDTRSLKDLSQSPDLHFLVSSYCSQKMSTFIRKIHESLGVEKDSKKDKAWRFLENRSLSISKCKTFESLDEQLCLLRIEILNTLSKLQVRIILSLEKGILAPYFSSYILGTALVIKKFPESNNITDPSLKTPNLANLLEQTLENADRLPLQRLLIEEFNLARYIAKSIPIKDDRHKAFYQIVTLLAKHKMWDSSIEWTRRYLSETRYLFPATAAIAYFLAENRRFEKAIQVLQMNARTTEMEEGIFDVVKWLCKNQKSVEAQALIEKIPPESRRVKICTHYITALHLLIDNKDLNQALHTIDQIRQKSAPPPHVYSFALLEMTEILIQEQKWDQAAFTARMIPSSHKFRAKALDQVAIAKLKHQAFG